MAGSKFQVKGRIKMDDVWMTYNTVVDAQSEQRATEQYYTIIGSKHRLKRSYIRIDGVTKIDGE